ncbi:hypothetical protein [Bernardetia sp. MNP-M8]|uniref:hypothetical protein n=1 Tax=Bernardetia sp. MNP-M8 TaxID=3127470 RepID=UPI0030CFDDA0
MKLTTTQNFHDELLLDMWLNISKSTVQIFKYTYENKLRGHGSGVLFQFEDNYFIITASHNFIEKNGFVGEGIDDFWVGVENFTAKDFRVGGFRSESVIFSLKNQNMLGIDKSTYERYKIDLAIIKITSQALIESLKSHKSFLSLSDISHYPKQRILEQYNKGEISDYYILYGFPASQTKVITNKYNPKVKDGEKILNANPYCQTEYLKNNVSKKLIEEGFTNHIFFSEFKKGYDLFSHQRKNKPIQRGMSGCGLWEIHIDTKGKPCIKLVGIFTEVEEGFGISVKLPFAIYFIREYWGLEKLPHYGIKIRLGK